MDETPSQLPSPRANVEILIVARFDASGLATIRQRVDALARRSGLTAEQAGDFVTAINEVMSNAVRHGGGEGELRLWGQNTRLLCEIRDRGSGFAASAYLGRRDRPTPSATGGMGLWIAQQTSDAISIDSGATGTTVRVSVALPVDGLAARRPPLPSVPEPPVSR